MGYLVNERKWRISRTDMVRRIQTPIPYSAKKSEGFLSGKVDGFVGFIYLDCRQTKDRRENIGSDLQRLR